ncbi:hypothetical protein M8494_11050 [Serratia ureilytica]
MAVNLVAGSDDIEAVRQATEARAGALMVLFLISIICHNSMNLYGAVLSLITAVQTFLPQWMPDARIRTLFSALILLGAVWVALVLSLRSSVL